MPLPNLQLAQLKGTPTMKVQRVLKCLLCVIMVGGFLAQMWNLFDQFLRGLKTVAISYEEKMEIEFPSFAICNSKAFTKPTGKIGNADRYNANTYDMENEIQFEMGNYHSGLDDWQNSYATEHIPTIFNGYCMLFEFHRGYPNNTWLCK